MRPFARLAPLVGATVLLACSDADRPVTTPEGSLTPLMSRSGRMVGPSPIGAPLAVRVEEVAAGLVAPVAVVSADDRTGRLFIVDQAGSIRVLMKDGTLLATPFLDVRARLVPLNPGFDERGLLGLAFHPDYRRNGRFIVYYSAPLRPGAPAGFNHTARIAEFRVSGNPNVADPASERVILEVDQPQGNHNGGTVVFGRDGYLYISLGDGGAGNDVALGHVEDWYDDNGGGNGQDIEQNLLGNILRIDVDRGHPYAIPRSNPFVGKRGLDEIWAYGLRNPYRMSFDRRNGRLFVGDAGQRLWEEVSIVRRGGNYGWNVKEGTHCFDAENNAVSPPSCPDREPGGPPLSDPIIEYANSAQPGGLGVTVIGGHVYRGTRVKNLRGLYVFGDFSRSFFPPNGSLFAASPGGGDDDDDDDDESDGGRLWTIHELMIVGSPNGRLNHYVTGFGEDHRGEIYVTVRDVIGPTGVTGRVYRIVAAPGMDRGDDDDDDGDDDDDDDDDDGDDDDRRGHRDR